MWRICSQSKAQHSFWLQRELFTLLWTATSYFLLFHSAHWQSFVLLLWNWLPTQTYGILIVKLKSQGFSKSADPRLLAFLFSSPNCRQYHLGYFQIQYLMIVIFISQTHNHCSPLLGGQMWKACKKSLGSPRCPRHLWGRLGVLASRQEGVHGLSPTIRPSVGSHNPFLTHFAEQRTMMWPCYDSRGQSSWGPGCRWYKS